MDHNDREQFWKTLCSLPGNDIVAEREQLFKSIKYPKLLFRYRPVSTKSLEALRTNRLYFSSANYYDDPFDTFLHIDIEAIRKEYLHNSEHLIENAFSTRNTATVFTSPQREKAAPQTERLPLLRGG